MVVDDSSDDDTADVAARHPVQYIRVEHRCEFLTRRDGFLATDSGAVVFLDADDTLPPDYLASGLRVLESDWRIGAVGTDLEYVGVIGGSRKLRDTSRLQRTNYIHAGAVVRSSAIRLSGMFDIPLPSRDTHSDWWQWRRLQEYGWQFGWSPSRYEYRRGHESMTARKRKAGWYERAGHAAARVTILVPLSGRWSAWERLREWFNDQAWPRDQIVLRLLDNSHEPAFGDAVRGWLADCDYPDVHHQVSTVGRRGLADEDRAQSAAMVEQTVCQLWSSLTRRIQTPWSLTMEDDVIPPTNVIERLLRSVDVASVDAVACPYPARGSNRLVVRKDGEPCRPGQYSGVEQVDCAGFGCLLVRSDLLEQHVFTHGPRGGRHWYDWWFYEATDAKVLCDFGMQAEHLV